MAVSVAELRRRGYSDDDIRLAQTVQEANQRAGAPTRTLAEVLAGQPARPRPSAQVEDLTARQLRRRGSYGQAALLAGWRPARSGRGGYRHPNIPGDAVRLWL